MSCRRSEHGDCVSFPEMAVMSQPEFSIGAHAMRGLIFSRPSSIEVIMKAVSNKHMSTLEMSSLLCYYIMHALCLLSSA